MSEANQQNRLTWPMARVEARIGRPLADELRDRYTARGQTYAEIGADLGVGATTIHRWMRAFGIESRFPGQRPQA